MTTKWQTNDLIDAEIRRCYAEIPSGKGILVTLTRRIRRPKSWISRRARALGLTHIRGIKLAAWSDEEKAILAERAAQSPQTIQRALRKAGYARSINAIYSERARQGHAPISEDRYAEGIYSAAELARCLGVADSTVGHWIRQGLLSAKIRPSDRKPPQGQLYEISERAVRTFLLRYTAHVDHRKAQKDWLFSVLSGNNGTKGQKFKRDDDTDQVQAA